MEEKKAKLVFNAGVVRKLLKAGCRIIDVKADRDNKDKTVFVFERDEAFEKAFSDINEELKKANDILTEECNKALMLNDKHGGEAKDLKEENEDLKKQLANALDLYDERGEVIEEYEDLKQAIRTITAIMSKVGGIK